MEPQSPRRRPRVAGFVLRQHRSVGGEHLAARGVHRAGPRPYRRGTRIRSGAHRFGYARAARGSRTRRHQAFRGARHPGVSLADVLRCVQTLHARRLPRRLPHRRPLPHRVRHGRGAGRRLQRLRHLRGRMPVRRGGAAQRWHVCHAGGTARAAGGKNRHRRRPEMHPLLRPPGRRPDTGLRPNLPDHVDQVRRSRRPGGAGAGTSRRATRPGPHRSPPLRRQRARRCRWHRVDVPAAGRTGGLRPAARSAGLHC